MKLHKRNFRQQALIDDFVWLFRKLMEEQKITQVELGRRTGRSKQLINNILSGERNLTLETISDILHALGKEKLFSRRYLLQSLGGMADSSTNGPTSPPVSGPGAVPGVPGGLAGGDSSPLGVDSSADPAIM
jgi:DNA-binding XRE family transcriptional regulator